jgi:hypothetical protein
MNADPAGSGREQRELAGIKQEAADYSRALAFIRGQIVCGYSF